MPRIAYTSTQKREAVALGRVMGADPAGKQLGIDPRTVVKWMRDAGDPPALRGTQEQWRQQFDLAHARLMERLASPTVTVHDLVLAKGVAERNMTEAKEAPPESSVAAHDAFVEWLLGDAVIDTLGLDTPESIEAFGALLPELIRRANAEEGQPHRAAILAWFSGRPEAAAGDVFQWAQDQTHVILAEHGDLVGLRQWRERRLAEAHEEMLAQLAKNAEAAEAWQRRSFDAETLALMERAEAWLAAHPEDPS